MTLHNATLGFPFVCLGGNGNALGPDDFVSGYTQVFVPSDGTVNNNPVIGGVSFNNSNVEGADAGADADAGAGADADADAGTGPVANPYCIDGVCVPSAAPTCATLPKPLHVPACSGNCPTYEFSPTIDTTDQRNNDSGKFASQGGSPIGEQMWVDYYTDRGSLNHAVRLLRDANLGWSSDFSDQWTPPSIPARESLGCCTRHPRRNCLGSASNLRGLISLPFLCRHVRKGQTQVISAVPMLNFTISDTSNTGRKGIGFPGLARIVSKTRGCENEAAPIILNE